MNRTADVVIVGGGVTGVSIAFHLAVLGVRNVVVLERRFIGAGGTGRSVGIVRQLYPTRETSEMVVRSLRIFRDFGEAVGGDAGYVRCGALISVSAAMRPRLEQTVARHRDLGIRADILEPAAAAGIESRLDLRASGAVLHEPDSGYGDPVGVAAGYAAAARRYGVRIEQDAEVVAIDVAADQVAGVRTRAGDLLSAPVVVNAAGLWAPSVAARAGLRLPIVIGCHPVFVIERDPAFGAAHPVYLDLAGGTYVRPETGGLTLTGSLTEDETRHPMDPEMLGADVALEAAIETLARTSQAVPALADARYRSGYAGAFDITPDWMPILDQTPVAGFWVAAGMSGHGFKLAPAVGETMAALITGGRPPVDPRAFRLDRFDGAAATGGFVSSYLR
jgi:glycine/D-amino acid oxidase-like deaminating enzyme